MELINRRYIIVITEAPMNISKHASTTWRSCPAWTPTPQHGRPYTKLTGRRANVAGGTASGSNFADA